MLMGTSSPPPPGGAGGAGGVGMSSDMDGGRKGDWEARQRAKVDWAVYRRNCPDPFSQSVQKGDVSGVFGIPLKVSFFTSAITETGVWLAHHPLPERPQRDEGKLE